jgi:D-amino peptidase
MVAGVDGCKIAMFLGYHAKFGTAKSTFDHTYAGSCINRVEVNGIEASEFMLNGYVAGDVGVPVALVAGEARLLEEDVEKYAPWAETVVLKNSLSRLSAKSASFISIEKDLRGAIRKAVASQKKNKLELLLAKKPVKIAVTFLFSHFADAASLLPSVKRVDGLKIEYTAKNMADAYKTFELLVLASNGMQALMESMR